MKTTIYVLDPSFRNLLGHYLPYDRSVAEAAVRKGLECIILGNRDVIALEDSALRVYPVYSADHWMTIPGEGYHSDGNVRAVSACFAAETFDFLRQHSLRAGDIIFLPTITKVHLFAVAALAEALGPRGVSVQALLRYEKSYYEGSAAASALRKIEELSSHFPIVLCTDSHRLASVYSSLTTLPIRVFPIPHTDQLAARQNAISKEPKAIHFISLGNARGEKGLVEIFEAIRRSADEPWAHSVRFTLQANNPAADVIDAIEAFRRNPDPRVVLLDRVLNPEEYYGLLESSDAVLVPYHRDVYQERTSGVFIEAVTAGKIVICTRDTWMSDLLDVHGGGIPVRDRAAIDLCAAIGEVISNLELLQRCAIAAAAHWKQIHSPDNLVDHLLGDSRRSAVPRKPRAAILYPWGDAATGRSGAVVRMRLLSRYLEQIYGEVRVHFASAGEKGGHLTPKIVAMPYHHLRIRSRMLRRALEIVSSGLGGQPEQSFHLWFHMWPWIDGRFQKRCEEIVSWADDIYVEYSYFVPVVARLCRRLGKRWIVTQYDILSEQSKGVPIVYRATQLLEFSALKRSPRVILCTERERSRCVAHGVQAETIVHPIDLDGHIAISSDEALFILRTFYGVQAKGRRLCLFVGSAYSPNVDAAKFIRGMARDLRHDARATEMLFVVIGACMEPVRDENFVAVGRIEDAGLAAFYKLADIVLVPVTRGTGSSIKSIEALAHGAVVLSTSIGMRGIPIEPGKHCLIEDDLSIYPQRIIAALDDGNALKQIRAAASELGHSYDYRTVFAAYRMRDLPHVTRQEDRNAELAKQRDRALRELLARAMQLEEPAAVEFIRERLTPKISEELAPAENADWVVQKDETTIHQPMSPTQENPDARREPVSAPNATRPLLHQIARSVALRIPQIRRLYQHAVSKTIENAALSRANSELQQSLTAEISVLAQAKDRVVGEAATLQIKYDALSRTIQEVQLTNEALSAEVEAQRGRNAETLHENETLWAKVGELRSANEEMLRKNEAFSGELGALRGEISALQNKLSEQMLELRQDVLATVGLPLNCATVFRDAVQNWEIERKIDRGAYYNLLERCALERGATCRWCDGTKTILLQRGISRYGDRSFDAWHCTECGCRFTNGDLLPVDYDKLGERHAWYKLHHRDAEHIKNILECGSEFFWGYMAAKYLADVPWFPDRRYRLILERVIDARIKGQKLKVIEVGCGLGALGGVISHLGHDYLGVDVMSDAQSHAADRFRRFGAQYESVAADWFEHTKRKGVYDLVVSTEVIEHTARPLGFLRRLVSLSKGNGEIILTTPDLDKNPLAVWATDLPPIHTVILNREAVELGCRRLGEQLELKIINEGGSFDWRRVKPKCAPPQPTLVPARPMQIDPSRPEFFYDVKNVDFGFPRLDVLERPDRLSEHYQEQMVLASLNNVRVCEESMIIRIGRSKSTDAINVRSRQVRTTKGKNEAAR